MFIESDCGDTPEVEYARIVTYHTMDSRQSLDYKCIHNSSVVGESFTYTCHENGSWTGNAQCCKKFYPTYNS